MRYLIIPLLLCTTTQAALINPLGGTWTDGTTVATYEELPSNSDRSRIFQSLLTVADNSHFLSRVRVHEWDGIVNITVDNSVDFYDGSGQVDGEFLIELTEPGEVSTRLTIDRTFDAYLDDTSVLHISRQRTEPGIYSLNWTVDSVALNYANETSLRYTLLPEPGAVGIIMCLLGLLIWWRIH